MKNILFVFLTLLLFSSVNAQGKVKYGSQVYAGLLTGSSGTDFQLHWINGVKYRQWFAGAGAGLDNYFLRSVPVYISLHRNLPVKLPVYVNAYMGLNFAWKDDRSFPFYGGENSRFSPGLYAAGGFGYALPMGKKQDRLLFHIGYSYKHITEKTENPVLCLVPPCPEYSQQYNFHLRRLSFAAGWMF